MRTSTHQNKWIVCARQPAFSNSTRRSSRHAQHVVGHRDGSYEGQSKIPAFHELDRREYASGSFVINNVEFVTVDAFKDNHPNVGGLCGAMGAGPNWRLPMFIRKAFKPLFSCQDDDRSAQSTLSSSTFDSAMDTVHDGSTTKCSNGNAYTTQETTSGYAAGYSAGYSEECLSAHSTDISTYSELEKLREENRRWRRGF